MSYMKNTLEQFIEDTAKKSGYTWVFLMDMWNRIMEEDGEVNIDYFVGVSMEHDW